MLDAKFLAAVEAIPWFDACGKAIEVDSPFAVQPVASWTDAEAACLDQAWEDATLEARNALTVFLHHKEHHGLSCLWRRSLKDWNKVTVEAKRRCVTPLAEKVWRPFTQEHGLSVKLVHSLEWNVLAAIMEHEYGHLDGRPTFFLHLLELYRAGHLPCGWTGGTYPSGKLLVF
jgi:hypothetical protein